MIKRNCHCCLFMETYFGRKAVFSGRIFITIKIWVNVYTFKISVDFPK